jgi:hypothetical protein
MATTTPTTTALSRRILPAMPAAPTSVTSLHQDEITKSASSKVSRSGRRSHSASPQNAPALGLSVQFTRIEATLPPPTYLQRTLSYIANGDAPPLPRLPLAIVDGMLSFTVSTAACLALGVLIGRGIVH